jgi:hypothetical protein
MSEPEKVERSANLTPQSQATTATIIDDDSNFSIQNNYKNFTSETNNDDITREELKSVQKSIALLKQDIRKILHEELFKFLLNERRRTTTSGWDPL